MHFNLLTVKLWPDVYGILKWGAYFRLSVNGTGLLEGIGYSTFTFLLHAFCLICRSQKRSQKVIKKFWSLT